MADTLDRESPEAQISYYIYFLLYAITIPCHKFYGVLFHQHWGLCNVGCPSETDLKPKSREISFAHNLLLSYLIVLKFCTEHGSGSAVVYANFKNGRTVGAIVMYERDFVRFWC